jgi:hypothetical protein
VCVPYRSQDQECAARSTRSLAPGSISNNWARVIGWIASLPSGPPLSYISMKASNKSSMEMIPVEFGVLLLCRVDMALCLLEPFAVIDCPSERFPVFRFDIS